MRALRAAVIGVGYLGNFHAQKYAQLDGIELLAVVDTDARRGAEVAAKYGTRAVTDYREILSDLDLVSIVVPPARHFTIAQDCLTAGVHALVEKPLTATVAEAEILIQIAAAQALVLQVGHLERFNPVVRALRERIDTPRLIEAQRFCAYKQRGTEVDVVLDLMIHDIDIVLSIVNSPLRAIHSSGTAVVTDDIDIAHARLEFASGCIAELSASRVSQEPSRVMKVYQRGGYLAIDYANHELRIGTVTDGREALEQREVTFETANIGSTDVLKAEIASFVAAVRHGALPEVTGEDGKRALEVAIDISHRIKRYRAAMSSTPDPQQN
jgi:predicted dehydrogenase